MAPVLCTHRADRGELTNLSLYTNVLHSVAHPGFETNTFATLQRLVLDRVAADHGAPVRLASLGIATQPGEKTTKTECHHKSHPIGNISKRLLRCVKKKRAYHCAPQNRLNGAQVGLAGGENVNHGRDVSFVANGV